MLALLSATTFSPLPASWQTLGLGAALSALALSVVGVFRAVYKGQLIPGPTHRRELSAEKERTADAERQRDMWQKVALEAMGQNSQLMPVAKVTQQVVQALPQALAAHDPAETPTKGPP